MSEWYYDGQAVRSMPTEELYEKLSPLINKFARWNIPGNTYEDLVQEVRLVIWLCQQSYYPERFVGFGGRSSGFINFVYRAIQNKFGKIGARERKFHAPVVALRCRACGMLVQPRSRATCPGCSGRRWEKVEDRRAGAVLSIENQLLHDPEDLAVESDELGDLPDWLPHGLIGAASRLLAGYDISKEERRSLRDAFKTRRVT